MQTLFLFIAILAIVLALLIVYGSIRWRTASTLLLQALEGEQQPPTPARYDPAAIADLPDPVQKFFRTVLTEGQPLVTAVTVEHSGQINLSDAGSAWRSFVSTQRIVTRRPGFDWDARIRLAPGLHARVHDAYVAGEGILHASLLGLMTLAKVRGTAEIDLAELQRFLAETVWHPTSLLPGQGVAWEAVDERSARAILVDGETKANLLFRFAADHRISSVHVEARPRLVGGAAVSTPWEGKFSDYTERDGLVIPLDAEVAWLVDGERHPYWRGRITKVAYEFAD